MGEGDRRGRQRLMSIAGGWEVTRQAGERGRCHKEAALTCAQLGTQQSPIPRLHSLQPLHLLGGSNFDPPRSMRHQSHLLSLPAVCCHFLEMRGPCHP